MEGSKDHPMISRYEGSYIRGYEKYAYDRLVLATEMEDGEIQETAFEGKVTRIHYVVPEGRSSLEVHRNYQMALRDAGFEIVYECGAGDDEKCGEFADFKIDALLKSLILDGAVKSSRSRPAQFRRMQRT